MKNLMIALAAVACVGLVGCAKNNMNNVQPSAGKVETHQYHDHGKFSSR